MFGFSEEFKHLVNPTHPDDKDFDSVVQLVQQGYKVKKSDWEQGFVDVFLQQKTLVDKAGQKTKMYSKTSKVIVFLMFYKTLSNLKLLSYVNIISIYKSLIFV